MAAEMESLAAILTAEGKTPYIIPGGGSTPIGALGYVNCVREIVEQADDIGLKIDGIVHATGSAGTQAGLVVGLAAIKSDIPLLGIGVRAPQKKQEQMVYDLAVETARYLDSKIKIERDKVQANCNYVGGGYGVPTEGMKTAVKLLAQTEGILLDPVYSGKGMDGFTELVRKGEFSKAKNIVFLHTGGSATLFGYPDIFNLSGYSE